MSSSQSIIAEMPNSRMAARGSSRVNRQPVFSSAHVDAACATPTKPQRKTRPLTFILISSVVFFSRKERIERIEIIFTNFATFAFFEAKNEGEEPRKLAKSYFP